MNTMGPAIVWRCRLCRGEGYRVWLGLEGCEDPAPAAPHHGPRPPLVHWRGHYVKQMAAPLYSDYESQMRRRDHAAEDIVVPLPLQILGFGWVLLLHIYRQLPANLVPAPCLLIHCGCCIELQTDSQAWSMADDSICILSLSALPVRLLPFMA